MFCCKPPSEILPPPTASAVFADPVYIGEETPIRLTRWQACKLFVFNSLPYKTVARCFRFLSHFTTDYDSLFYYSWLWIISTAVFYNVILVPLRASFTVINEEHPIAWLWLDYAFADALYLADMFIRSRTTYYLQGNVVTNTPMLRRRYMSSWQFVYDVLSILPTDLIYFGLDKSYYTIVRINRLIRIPRIFELTARAGSVTTFPNVFRMATTISGVLIALHYLAVFYYSYSKAYGFGTNHDPMCNFQLSVSQAHQPFVTVYTHCFYWATMTLCFIGEMPPPSKHAPHQSIIQSSIWLSGLMMFGAIVGRISTILNNVGAASNNYQRQVDTVRLYLNLQRVSSELYEKVILWFGYAFENRVSRGEEEALKPLPEKMKAEIASDIHLDSLTRVQLFADLDKNVLSDLVTSFHLQVFSPNDFVCKKGDIGREMYVVKRGKLEVISDDGKKVFVTLGAGSVFGEVSLLSIPGSTTGNRRTANVRSKGYSDLFSLSKDDFYRCLMDYPDAMAKIVQAGTDLLRREGKIDDEAIAHKQRAEEALRRRVRSIEKGLEEAETRFARLLADIITSRQTASRRLEVLEQRMRIPPPISETDEQPAEYKKDTVAAVTVVAPTSMSVSPPLAPGVLVRGLGAIPTVQLLPATPTHSTAVTPVPET